MIWFSGPFALPWSFLAGPSASIWNLEAFDLCICSPGKGGAVASIITATAVASYLFAEFMPGFERPMSNEGKALTMREIDMIPSQAPLFHEFLLGWVLI